MRLARREGERRGRRGERRGERRLCRCACGVRPVSISEINATTTRDKLATSGASVTGALA